MINIPILRPSLLYPSSFRGLYVVNVGAPILNYSDGFQYQRVTVRNDSPSNIAALKIFADNLRSGVYKWNTYGTDGGKPYWLYNNTIQAGETVILTIEFYAVDYAPFTDTISISETAHIPISIPAGSAVSARPIQYVNGTDELYGIEFISVPLRHYCILYGTDINTITNVAVPSIQSIGNGQIWYDYGAVKTTNITQPPLSNPLQYPINAGPATSYSLSPFQNGARWYKVILLP